METEASCHICFSIFHSLFYSQFIDAKTEFFRCVTKLIDYGMIFQVFFNCGSAEENIIIQLSVSLVKSIIWI